MKAQPIPWWQNLQIIAWVAGGLAALGTGIVVAARYIELPAKVEAAQQKNTQQDEAIQKLIGIEETWQNIYQQQRAQARAPDRPAPAKLPQPPSAFREQDHRTGEWWCCALPDYHACWEQHAWTECE